jgi:hypothetical protein
MKELRDYQKDIASRGVDILTKNKIVYLALAVRTGKSATSMEVAKLYGAKKILFITKIKAFSSIQSDYDNFGYEFEMTIINKESIHKIKTNDFDLIVCDEAHGLFGSFPKPNNFTKIYKKRFSKIPSILLSGTMSPESFSQVFHQFWINDYTPFSKYTNFYKWSHDYVNIQQKRIGSFMHNDYSSGKEDKIMQSIAHLMITFTQEEAGFTSKIDEEVLYVPQSNVIRGITTRLIKDLIVEGEKEVILADTAAKLMQKLHQLYSGTVKFESGNSMIIDTTKAEFIKERFAGSKIGIFYVFKEEYNALIKVFGEDNLTNDLDEFNATSKNIALQIVSGREGISLRNADFLVFYNIQHSAVSYFQGIDRMTTINRLENKVYWVFTEGGIEDKIFKVVKSKKKYTLNIFKKDYELTR